MVRTIRFISLIVAMLLLLAACSTGSQDGGTDETTQSQQDKDRVTTINADSFYPEGPLWLDDKLFYVEYSKDRIMTWNGQRNDPFWRQDGCGASGLVQTPDKTLLVTCYDSNTLAEVNQDGETVKTIKADSAGHKLLGPNDFAKDSRGGIYFSASGTYTEDAPVRGKIYYIAPGSEIRQVAKGIHYSNGLGLTPDGDRLIAAEMLEKRVLSFGVQDDGSLDDRRVFANTEDLAPTPSGPGPLDGPDGLKVDDEGYVYIAQNGAGRVLIVNPDAKLVQKVKVPADHVTNVAFGPTSKRLYITSAVDPNNEPYPGEVYRADLP